MSNTSKHLENPLPYLHEAGRSAARIFEIEKQLLEHRAEKSAILLGKKAGFAIVGAISATLGVLFGWGWLTIALNEAGWSPVLIAVSSFLLFNLVAWVFITFFTRSLELKEERNE